MPLGAGVNASDPFTSTLVGRRFGGMLVSEFSDARSGLGETSCSFGNPGLPLSVSRLQRICTAGDFPQRLPESLGRQTRMFFGAEEMFDV
ncbi:hypothetical protein E1287_27245 [Actinomadura sp. KC06]|uniref:hypothetical protein n=1 Tax=Actinomadura sp. KC06 TaxID=2530369 RepID=UPI00104A9A8A|nr:hypothetical protein [Actinomadura sp. KC06]TDD31214.1 hypothetical protein E1287_27245 [Actinomadura sp. KC06]